jgi:Sulfatase-modifying factor enzyme 1/Putative metal-binding motif
MFDRCWCRSIGLVFLLLSVSGVASAQIKPRFSIAVDTSGSMFWDLNNKATYGDGVGRPKQSGDSAALVKDGVFYGCGTSAGLDRNCDGLPNDSKIAVAKNAIRNMVLGFGDVEWSLSKFHQTHQSGVTCSTFSSFDTSCSSQAIGNPQCNTGNGTGSGCVTDVAASCRPGAGGNASLHSFKNGDFNGCINYGTPSYSPAATINSPNCPANIGDGADLLVEFTGFGAFTALDNRTAILKWMDNVETSFNTGSTPGNFCNHATTGDCELRPSGFTPLGSLIQKAGGYAQTIRDGDASKACRQYSTILVTDGAETCNTNPNQEAFKLAYPTQAAAGTCNPAAIPAGTPAVRTYVVGISIVAGEQTSLSQIAACGGTGTAYFASSASELSAALADIVNRSILVEVCNGKDDDCDTRIDEGIPTGVPGPAPQPNALFCDGEGHRSVAQNAQVQLRPDYADNLAQNAPVTLPVVCGHVPDTCSHPFFDDDCDGKLDEDATNLTSCGTCPGAVETCDGIDNDCDGVIDEKANTGVAFSVCPTTCARDVPCGSGIGACHAGVYQCVGNVLNTSTCVGEIKPTTEVCDEKDNDCNGIVDDPGVLARACTTPWGNVGICLPGIQLCAKPSIGEHADGMGYHVDNSNKAVCAGQVTPEDREQCDLLDHDCDGNPFTCTQSTCVVGPQPVGVGDACGQGVGSCRGTLICDMTAMPPALVCNAPGGSPEICDNLDNDCDGAVDEGLSAGGPCGSGVGECKPGTYQCDTTGQQKCIGDVGPTAEVCDGLDNDCDGIVDESLGLGDACGSDVGACKPGKLACAAGRPVCSGEVGPELETCDCMDNDCDGKIDEGTGDNPVCPSGSSCTMCQCALPCAATQEFVAECPQGKAAVTDANGCFCVGARCDDTQCKKQTIEVSGELQCAPSNPLARSCFCKNNECTFSCSGVQCDQGLVCDPTDGRCRQSTCLLPQFKCPDAQRCGLLGGVFQCVDDACSGVSCNSNEACRDGTCIKSCAQVSCDQGSRCVDGACEVDACAKLTCTSDQACDRSQGSCVAAGACVLSGCPDGNVCDAVSGTCAEDPCLHTHCPVAEQCNSANAQCESRCPSDQVYCAGQCINPQANKTYCGASADCQDANAGTDCGSSSLVCSQGSCSTSCGDGLLECDGACLDPKTDSNHCGASKDCKGVNVGETCGATQTCVAGSCHSQSSATPGTSPGRRFAATGGGGCACSVGPGLTTSAADDASRLGSLLLWLAVIAFWRRRRWLPALVHAARRMNVPATRTGGWLALWLLCAVIGGGCKVKTICLDCTDAAQSGTGPMTDAGLANLSDTGTGTAGAPDTGVPEGGTTTGEGGTLNPSPEAGTAACVPGSVELCNGLDDDCDGKIDEDADPAASNIDIQTNPQHCGSCSNACTLEHAFNVCKDGKCEVDRSSGDQGCDIGFHDLDNDPSNGCEYRCIKSADDDSICDLRDNDCDGKIDENVDVGSDPANCGRCGLRCIFAHAANGARCVDKSCVLDASKCDSGFVDVDQRPLTGCEYRCPVQPTAAETCNTLDDDCDGKIDEQISTSDDSRIGVACGTNVGECKPGVTACMAGAPVCLGATAATLEVCDGKDNDCDNKTDEGFDTTSDLSNCGTCGKKCVLNANVPNGHAVLVCQASQCKVGACIGDFANRNGDYKDGCETPCSITGNEVCDGTDNDCNGAIDDNVVAPAVVCVARETGVCAVNQAALDKLHQFGPKCTAGALSCNPTGAGIPDFQAVETLCDGKDNDCDGKVDEMLPSVGQPCSKGQGACRTTGVNACDGSVVAGFSCNAATPSTGSAEACDGLDNDCNGVVDDFSTPTASITGLQLVDLGAANNHTLIMAYEASRPDATASDAGKLTQKACSAAAHQPWANVTWGEAGAACCALNTNGQCAAGGKGWRLCDSATWVTACKGNTNSCTWAYSDSTQCAHDPSVTTSQGVCLGSETTVSCPAGVSQCATTTGSSSFQQCRAPLTGGNVYDLSGNLKEWTNTAQGTNIYELRGGSYNNVEAGRTCDFNFTVGDTAFRFPTTGFRCCYYP